jgi:tetratricopeptide (TPR) repeat protein
VVVLVLSSGALADDLERGQEALEKMDYDLAIACFNACIKEDRRNTAAYLLRARAYAAKKDYDRAFADYGEAIRIKPRDPVAYNARGSLHYARKDYNKAIADYSDAIRIDPKYAFAYNNRGAAYEVTQDYDRALVDYSEAIRLNPNYANAFFNRGDVHRKQKNYEKAVADYSEAVRLEPKSASSLNALAWLLATCPKDGVRDGKRAVELATKACELSAWKGASYLETLASAHAECGDFKEAIKWETKALELGFDDKDAVERARQRLRLFEEGKPYRAE